MPRERGSRVILARCFARMGPVGSGAAPNDGTWKTSLVFTARNIPGALALTKHVRRVQDLPCGVQAGL